MKTTIKLMDTDWDFEWKYDSLCGEIEIIQVYVNDTPMKPLYEVLVENGHIDEELEVLEIIKREVQND